MNVYRYGQFACKSESEEIRPSTLAAHEKWVKEIAGEEPNQAVLLLIKRSLLTICASKSTVSLTAKR